MATVGLVGRARHEEVSKQAGVWVERLVEQQGDWRRGLDALLSEQGIVPKSLGAADRSNPLVQFALLLKGTGRQVESLLGEQAGLTVALRRSVETRLPDLAVKVRLTHADVQRILVSQRTNTAKLNQMGRVLEDIRGFTTPRPTLVLPPATLLPGKERGNPFVFSERFVPLVGRDDLMAELHRFLAEPNVSATDHRERFAWWWMHGEGGSGKSRIAHELCIDARALGWNSGRLDVNEPFEDWRRWEIDRPTLMVIDYAGDRGRTPAVIVETLAQRVADLPHPVRVLLLDRSRTESLDRLLKRGMGAGGANAIGQREHLTDGAMRPLDDDALRELIGFAHFWFKGTRPDLDRALGDAKAALEKYREAERIDRAVYGDNHPSVATRVNNVGGALQALGDAKAALEKYREALRILLRASGARGESTLAVAFNVAQAGGDVLAIAVEIGGGALARDLAAAMAGAPARERAAGDADAAPPASSRSA